MLTGEHDDSELAPVGADCAPPEAVAATSMISGRADTASLAGARSPADPQASCPADTDTDTDGQGRSRVTVATPISGSVLATRRSTR
jgi:hypothetical protein